jgi:hypothetical protein
MGWVRLDEGFAEHPKLARVGAIGTWLQVQALCYAHRNLTDGFIPWAVARGFIARGLEYVDPTGQRWTLTVTSGIQGRDLVEIDWLSALVDAGVWAQVPGGYQIHDYAEYQPTRAQVLAERALWSARQRMRAPKCASGSLFPPDPPLPSLPLDQRRESGSGSSSGSGARSVLERATRWPLDFTLTEKRRALAIAAGVDAAAEWNAFRDCHQAKGSRFVNWDAAWRTWLRRAPDFHRSRA